MDVRNDRSNTRKLKSAGNSSACLKAYERDDQMLMSAITERSGFR